MAKGVEDTAFYRYHRLVSLNEVGGDPGVLRPLRWTLPRRMRRGRRSAGRAAMLDALDPRHQAQRRRAGPARTALRDPRRVGRGRRAAGRRRNERHRRGGWPDRNAEYLLYQTLVGAWPIDAERARAPSWRRRRARRRSTPPGPTRPATTTTARRRVRAGRRSATPGSSPTSRHFLAEHRLVAPRPGDVARPDDAAAHLSRACPTSTRAPSCGTSAWSTPTTAGRSTTSAGARLLGRAARRGRGPTRCDAWTTARPKLWLVAAAARRTAAARPDALRRRGLRAARRAAARRRAHAVALRPRRPRRRRAPPRRRPRRRWGDTTVDAARRRVDRRARRAHDLDGGAVPARELLGDVPRRRPRPGRRLMRRSACGRRTPSRVELVLGDGERVPMEPGRATAGGRATADGAGPGARYGFSLDGGPPRPDPRSPSQPDGVDGLSAVVDHDAFAWTDDRLARRRPCPAPSSTSCTSARSPPEGTFDGAIERLDHLVDLGVDAVELMPVAEFSGRRGLGLRRRRPVRAAPRLRRARRAEAAGRRLPRGRPRRGARRRLQPPRPGRELPRRVRPVLHRAPPDQLGRRRQLRRPGQRRGARGSSIDNALHVAARLPLDGLRLDAVHAIVDDSAVHILEQLGGRGGRARRPRRPAAVRRSPRATCNDPRVRAPPRRRRLRARRRVGRRVAPRAARRAHRRDATATTRTSARCRCWPRRCARRGCYDGTWSPHRAGAHGRAAGRPARPTASSYRSPEPRPGRQPGDGRAPRRARRPPGRLRVAAALLLTAPFVPDAVPGRGVGRRRRRSSTSPTTTTPSSGEAVRDGPPAASSRAFGWAPGGRARPAGPGHVRALEARLGRGGERGPRRSAGLVPPAHRRSAGACPPSPTTASTGSMPSDDEAASTLVVRRGARDGGRQPREPTAWMPLRAGVGCCLARRRSGSRRRASLPTIAVAWSGPAGHASPSWRSGTESRSGRASPTPSAPPTTARARTSRCSPRWPRRVELCLFDDDGRRRGCRSRGRRAVLARLPARRRARPALRLPGPRPLGPGRRPALQPGEAPRSTPTPGDRGRGRLGRGLLPVRLRRADGPAQRRRQRAAHAQGGRRQPVLRLVDRPRRRDRRGTRRSSTRCTSRGSPPGTPTSPRTCAAPTPGSPTRRPSSTSPTLGVTAVELLPVHQFVHDSHLVDEACATTGATTRSGSSPRTTSYAASSAAGRAGAGVQGHGAGAARRRHRGDPRRRLQPHRRGQPPRPDAVVQGHRQRRLLPPGRRRPALLLRHHGHREQPEHAPPRTRCS